MGLDFSVKQGVTDQIETLKAEGYVVVEARENLGERDRRAVLEEIRRRFANERATVIMATVIAMRLRTREQVALTLYFAKKAQNKAAGSKKKR